MNQAKLASVPDPTSRDIEFKSADSTQLAGTFLFPPGELKGRRPCVLLLPGSGPTDRDGNQPLLRTDTLKQLAQGLAEAGIASFRFDKRAVARYAQAWPKEPSKLGPYFSWTHHVDDVVAAWRTMTGDPLVDPQKCAVLGHSEGGVLALEAAARVHPAALVLMGTPARSFNTLVREQLEHQLDRAGDPALKKRLLTANDRVSRAVVETGRVPEDVPDELRALYNPSVGVYLRELSRVDPVGLLRTYDGPVLIVNGALDVQVSPDRDAKALEAAARTRTGRLCRVVIAPLASHNLKPVKTADEPGFEGEVVPDVIEAVQKFLVPLIGGSLPSG